MNVLVSGDDSFHNYALLERKLNKITKTFKRVILLTGINRGADDLAMQWQYARFLRWKRQGHFQKGVRKHGYTRRFHPFVDDYPEKIAVKKRNREMVAEAGIGIFFTNGRSKDVAHCIECCKKKGIRTIVIRYSKED